MPTPPHNSTRNPQNPLDAQSRPTYLHTHRRGQSADRIGDGMMTGNTHHRLTGKTIVEALTVCAALGLSISMTVLTGLDVPAYGTVQDASTESIDELNLPVVYPAHTHRFESAFIRQSWPSQNGLIALIDNLAIEEDQLRVNSTDIILFDETGRSYDRIKSFPGNKWIGSVQVKPSLLCHRRNRPTEIGLHVTDWSSVYSIDIEKKHIRKLGDVPSGYRVMSAGDYLENTESSVTLLTLDSIQSDSPAYRTVGLIDGNGLHWIDRKSISKLANKDEAITVQYERPVTGLKESRYLPVRMSREVDVHTDKIIHWYPETGKLRIVKEVAKESPQIRRGGMLELAEFKRKLRDGGMLVSDLYRLGDAAVVKYRDEQERRIRYLLFDTDGWVPVAHVGEERSLAGFSPEKIVDQCHMRDGEDTFIHVENVGINNHWESEVSFFRSGDLLNHIQARP